MVFRIAPGLKELVEEAAAVSGRSTTDFVTEAARERAIQVLREQQDVTIWRLAGEDALAFAEAITGAAEPNPRLEAAYAKYRRTKVLRRGTAADAEADGSSS
jgi:uncharacterized protein (DUF1778 family)